MKSTKIVRYILEKKETFDLNQKHFNKKALIFYDTNIKALCIYGFLPTEKCWLNTKIISVKVKVSTQE